MEGIPYIYRMEDGRAVIQPVREVDFIDILTLKRMLWEYVFQSRKNYFIIKPINGEELKEAVDSGLRL